MGTEKLGEYLKRERELRGITLDELSQGTKISKRLLIYMESGQWDQLPGEVFARGFLKSYAEFIGIVPEEILLRFEEEKLMEDEEQNVHHQEDQKVRFQNILFFILLALAVGVIGYFSYTVFLKDSPDVRPGISNSTVMTPPPQKDQSHPDGNALRE